MVFDVSNNILYQEFSLIPGDFPGSAALENCVGRLAQLARALASHARGHWFESSIAHHRFSTEVLETGPIGKTTEVKTADLCDRCLADLSSSELMKGAFGAFCFVLC
jgi:hypothetical protein